MRANERVLVQGCWTNKDNTSDCKWDRHLDDYNNYVKEYNKHYIWAQKGNQRSIALYPYMKEKWSWKRSFKATIKTIAKEKREWLRLIWK
jgi:hypothetical protein